MNPAQWRDADSLFVFGSLMDSAVLELVCGMSLSDLEIAPATVRGYRQCEVVEESYPVLVGCEASCTTGLLVQRLTINALQRILFFEGEEYSLQPIDAVTGHEVKHAFYFRDTGTYTVRDSMWDFDQWSRLHKTSFIEASRDYMALFGKMSVAEADAYWGR